MIAAISDECLDIDGILYLFDRFGQECISEEMSTSLCSYLNPSFLTIELSMKFTIDDNKAVMEFMERWMYE